jgi:hypothetical protein
MAPEFHGCRILALFYLELNPAIDVESHNLVNNLIFFRLKLKSFSVSTLPQYLSV